MPRPLYPQGNSPQYPLDRRLGGPQSQSGGSGEEKNCPLAHSQSLYQLSYHSSCCAVDKTYFQDSGYVKYFQGIYDNVNSKIEIVMIV
jgi:hypothetical protein